MSSLADQTRQAYASVAGERAAAAAFGAASGAVVGPIQSDFGWVVVKIDAVKREGGKSLDQARSEIAAKLNAEKRKAALEELVDRVQTVLDEGRNFAEAASQAPVPGVMMGGSGNGASASRQDEIRQLMGILATKTARDLSLDMKVKE